MVSLFILEHHFSWVAPSNSNTKFYSVHQYVTSLSLKYRRSLVKEKEILSVIQILFKYIFKSISPLQYYKTINNVKKRLTRMSPPIIKGQLSLINQICEVFIKLPFLFTYELEMLEIFFWIQMLQDIFGSNVMWKFWLNL